MSQRRVELVASVEGDRVPIHLSKLRVNIRAFQRTMIAGPKLTILVVVTCFVVALLLVSAPVHAEAADDSPTSPAVPVAPVDLFSGPNFVDFWWDPADIPGCASILLYRKPSSGGAYAEVASPACGAGLLTDSPPDTDTAYSYQFIVKNSADPPATIYLTFKSATPGEISGKLHRSLTLGGSLRLSGVNVATDAVLTLNAATITGGTISDSIFKVGSAIKPGVVIVKFGAFDGTSFHLENRASTIHSSQLTKGSISTGADVKDSTIEESSIGFLGDGNVILSGNTISNSTVSVAEAVNANIGTNAFIDTDLLVADSANADVNRNTFLESSVRLSAQTTARIRDNTFTGHIPDTQAMIQAANDAGITIDNNTLQIETMSGSHPAISIKPAVTPAGDVEYTVSGNVLTGSDGGVGIQVLTDCGVDIPNVVITDNTVGSFEQAVSLSNSACPNDFIVASINGNTLTNNAFGISADVEGPSNAVAAHNNCIASNVTAGIHCRNDLNVIDATNNYWGHRTGPTHSSNPGGLGDRLWCSDDGREINYDPWLTEHACYVAGLAIAKIEVIQSVQTLSNTIPLVDGKATVVRVYPDVDAGFALVDGSLTGLRDDVSLGTLKADRPIGAGAITDWDVARSDAGSSLNFELPEEWLSGVVTLSADVSAGEKSASATATARFNKRRPIKIAYIPISVSTVSSDHHPVTYRDILDVHEKLLARFPIGDVAMRILPALDRYADPSDVMPGLDFHYIAAVARRWELINNRDNVADYYVTIYGTEDENYTGSWLFWGAPNGVAACGLRNEGQDCMMAIGNQFGLRPLLFSADGAAPPFDYVFPYDPSLTHIFGYDTGTSDFVKIQSPDLYDVMSTEARDGLPSWISDFHYEKVYLNFATIPVDAASSQGANAIDVGDYLYVSGLVGPADGRFHPIVLLEDSPKPDGMTPLTNGGDYCLRARDGVSVVEQKCFDLSLTNAGTGEEGTMAAFTAFLTPRSGLRQLQLLYKGSTVKTMVIPTNPPAVILVSASYDNTYQSAQLAWTTPLEDAPNLRYHVHYSADNGVSWTPIGINLSPSDVKYFDQAFHWGVHATQIEAGAQARLRLIASDGFNETVVTSEAFTVPDVGPWVDITAPANNVVVDAFPIILEGYAYDIESGDHTNAATWTSSMDGPLGSGGKLTIEALSDGIHTITLTADDGQGHTATDTIRVTVGAVTEPVEHIYLPQVVR